VTRGAGDELARRYGNERDTIRGLLTVLYGERVEGTHGIDALEQRLLAVLGDNVDQRPAELQSLDAVREQDPGWFLRADRIGYVCYVDRFAGTLRELADRLDHLVELGTSYLHLMPLLRSRPGENDGGYAVADYRCVEPGLGTIDDLAELASVLRGRGISLCIDLVVNHTACEHPWAQAAIAGDPTHRAFYRTFADRTLPDAYERTLREIFPAWAPGSFSWVPEMQLWVWTTFREFQWDLDWSNPDVLLAMVDNLLFLANRGVEVFRLDAVAFMWKRLGTSCENLPETHLLLCLLRAIARVAVPAVVFKAEAIVAPDDLVQYLGAGTPTRRECDLAYNNQLMVMLWNSLATRDARLMTTALQRLTPHPAGTTWATYVRCHDDIGWAVSDVDAAAVGWDGTAHRAFLSDFYAGTFPGSFARGATFQLNPATGDRRISGSAASLVGIEAALEAGDDIALTSAIDRLVLLYALTFAAEGIPLVYMGDELALCNDHGFLDRPEHADDNRWLHRPAMDWSVAARRHDPTSVEGRVFGWIRRLAAARRQLVELDATSPSFVFGVADPALFCLRRSTRGFLAVANFSDEEKVVALRELGTGPCAIELGAEGAVLTRAHLVLPPVGFVWLVEPTDG